MDHLLAVHVEPRPPDLPPLGAGASHTTSDPLDQQRPFHLAQHRDDSEECLLQQQAVHRAAARLPPSSRRATGHVPQDRGSRSQAEGRSALRRSRRGHRRAEPQPIPFGFVRRCSAGQGVGAQPARRKRAGHEGRGVVGRGSVNGRFGKSSLRRSGCRGLDSSLMSLLMFGGFSNKNRPIENHKNDGKTRILIDFAQLPF